ncbi:MAG TPA: hypothetical protein DHV30_17115 [Balneola sp.]|nr:hypothetical protein [Balneola sp.]
MGDYRDHPFIKDMVRRGFEAFADKQLGYFEESKQKEIGFVGSIASVYKDILEDVLVKRGMNLAVVVRKPLENLVDFHNS